jgi:hypothetical protein
MPGSARLVLEWISAQLWRNHCTSNGSITTALGQNRPSDKCPSSPIAAVRGAHRESVLLQGLDSQLPK